MMQSDWHRRQVFADESARRSELRNTFVVRGRGLWGGSADVQGKLASHGICRYMAWDPSPPAWRFLYETHLTRHQVLAVLGPAVERWQVTVE